MSGYRVFTRTWWRNATPKDGKWPNGLVPCMGRKYTIARVETEEQARERCRLWNSLNKPGRFSRKAEYES